MELLLNSLWLAVCAFSFGAWYISGGKQKGSEPITRIPHEVFALGSALILLFFPISLTDDLHPEIALVADSLSQRRVAPTLCAVKALPHPARDHSAQVEAAFRTKTYFSPVFAGLVEVSGWVGTSSAIDAKQSRAPPPR